MTKTIFDLGAELTEVYAQLSTVRLQYSEAIEKLREVEADILQFYQARLVEYFKKLGSSTAAKANAEYEKTLHPKYPDYLKLKIQLEKLDKEFKVLENQIKVLNSLQYLQTIEAKYT